jgi:hypothetical protein
MAAVLKTAMGRESHRGFESHTLRTPHPPHLSAETAQNRWLATYSGRAAHPGLDDRSRVGSAQPGPLRQAAETVSKGLNGVDHGDVLSCPTVGHGRHARGPLDSLQRRARLCSDRTCRPASFDRKQSQPPGGGPWRPVSRKHKTGSLASGDPVHTPGAARSGNAPQGSPLTRPGASVSWAFPPAFPPIRSGPSSAVGTLHFPTRSAVTGDGTPGTPRRSKTSQSLRRDRRHVGPEALTCQNEDDRLQFFASVGLVTAGW